MLNNINLTGNHHLKANQLLKRNLIANYVGQGWASLSTFVFVPVYIHHLGLEAYGLIGFFAMLHAWFTLLDAGMGPALGREMARFTGGRNSTESIRDLLFSVETIALITAIGLITGLWLASGWMAEAWFVTQDLSTETVKTAIGLMGFVAALRVLEGIYRSALLGLQKQVTYNYILIVNSTIKSVGAVGVIVLVDSSIEAFFLWQALASIFAVSVLAMTCRKVLPQPARKARFSVNELRKVWIYARGMLAITFLSLILMQIDKLVLSSTLPLADFGVYSLASTVAMAVLVLVTPINQVWFPRLSQLHATNDAPGMKEVFHIGAQLLSVILGSAVIVLFLFSERVLELWTQDSLIAKQAAPLLAILIVGNLLNGLMWMPYQAQLAHGWTSLSVRINLVTVIVLVPATFWVAQKYGPLEVCFLWLGVNAAGLIVGGKLTFDKILKGEYWRWLREDMGRPLVAALITASFLKAIAPYSNNIWLELAYIACTSLITLAVATVATPHLRKQLSKLIF